MTSHMGTYSVLLAPDLQRARRFSSDMLGLEPAEERPEGLIHHTKSGAMILINETTFASTDEATAIGLLTDRFDADMADLRARGLSFEDYDLPGLKTGNGVVARDGAKGSWCKHSAGNIVSLSEDLFSLRARRR